MAMFLFAGSRAIDAMAGGMLTYSDTFKFNDNKVAIAKALLNEFHKTGDYPQQYMNDFRKKFPADYFASDGDSESDKAKAIIVGVMSLKNKQNILSQVFVGIKLSGNQTATEKQFKDYAAREGTWDGTAGTWTPNPPTGEDEVEPPAGANPTAVPTTTTDRVGGADQEIVGASPGTVASTTARFEAETALSGTTRELSEVKTDLSKARAELSNAKENGEKLAGCLKQLEEVQAKVQALKAAKEEAESKKPAKGQLSKQDRRVYDAILATWEDVTKGKGEARDLLEQEMKGSADICSAVLGEVFLSKFRTSS